MDCLGHRILSTKHCCRTCKHCSFEQNRLIGACSLRKLNVEVDLATVLVCHHWTKREPSLPKLENIQEDIYSHRQLEFNRSLVNAISSDLSL